jgi:transposase-like protein
MRFTKTIASASVAAVLGLAGVSVAGAASTSGSTAANPAVVTSTTVAGTKTPAAKTPAAKTPAAKAAHRKAAAQGLRRFIRRQGGTLAAKTIGISRADLVKELRGGKTIAAIATEHGVAPQTVITALESGLNAKVQAAVTAGKIKAARGTKLAQRIDTVVPKIVNTWVPKAKANAKAKG